MLQSEKYTRDYFFWILPGIEMRFGHTLLVYIMAIISYMFYFNSEEWELVPGQFMIWTWWRHNKICYILVANIYHLLTFTTLKRA